MKENCTVIVYISDSQPGCRVTLGCHKEVSGVPLNFELLPLIDVLLHVMKQIVILNQVKVPPNLFKDLKGAVNQKRLKKLVYILRED